MNSQRRLFGIVFPGILSLCLSAVALAAGATDGKVPDKTEPQAKMAAGCVQLFGPAAYRPGGWQIVWRKDATVKFPENDKTPDGGRCVEIAFTGNGNCGHALSPILPKEAPWRQKSYGELSFWIKGNAGGKKIRCVVKSTDGTSSWSIPLDTSEWKKCTLSAGTGYTKTEQANLSALQHIYFAQDISSPVPTNFRVGGFELKEAAAKLPALIAPSLIIPLVPDASVKLDGTLTEPVWSDALKIDNFKLLHSGKTPAEKTELMLFATQETLYLGVRMFCADTTKLKALKKHRDEAVYFDDCLEIFVDDNLDAKTYRHLSCNPCGTVADYHYRFDQTLDHYMIDRDWNPKWTHKSGMTEHRWNIEIAIPLAELGIVPGQPFCLQVGRENKVTEENSCLALAERFPTPANFAVAVIGKAVAAPPELKLATKAPGEMVISGTTRSAKQLALTLDTADIYGKKQRCKLDCTTDTNGEFSLPFTISGPVEGAYRIIVTGSAGGKAFRPVPMNFTMVVPPDIAFGDIWLNPQPKKIAFTAGHFTFDDNTAIVIPDQASLRTLATARHLRNELHQDLFGMLPPLRRGQAGEKSFFLALRKDAKLSDSAAQKEIDELPPEGYYLSVTPEKVTIIGVDEPGLYYGVVTLIQLCRANLIKRQAPAIGGVNILDWPDLHWRMVQHYPPAHKTRKELGHDIVLLKELIKNVIAGSKMNYYAFEMKYEYEFDKYAQLSDVKSMMRADELRELADFCRQHFVEFIPMLDAGGRGENFIKAFPELRAEPSYPRLVNTLHKKWHDILFNCYDDILRALPQTRYFMIRLDEWWHSPKGEVTTSFQGVPKWKIFADNAVKSYEYFKRRNISTIMYADILLKEHNGGYPLNLWQAINLLPRDIIMSNWSTKHTPDSTVMLHEKGFQVIDTFNQFGLVPVADVPIIMGYSTIFYAHFMQTIIGDNAHLCDYTHGVLRGADYAWNLKRDAQIPLGEWRRRYLKNLMPLYFFPKRRTVGWKDVKPLNLQNYVNSATGKWFGQPELVPIVTRGNTSYGFIPFRLQPEEADDVIAATPEKDEIRIAFGNRPVSSIFFLLGAYLPKEKRQEFMKRGKMSYRMGVPMGEIRIEYEDSPSEIVPLRLGYNINEITPTVASREMYGTRFTHDTKTRNGTPASLYVLEWVDPHPGRRVKNIVWKGYGLEAVPVLFAVTSAR